MEISINGKRIAVTDLSDAQNKWNNYVKVSRIGASGMKRHDGKVFQGKKLVATVSYNGRVWNPDGTEIS